MSENEPNNKATVFISYSHKDEAWKDRLVTHLGVLSAQGLLNFWQDRLIGAGEDWRKNIEDAMSAASIAVLLISANSLTSEFILNEEVPKLLQRRAKEGVRIFPVIVEPSAWQTVGWLSQMNVRPKDGHPLSAGNENQVNADLAAIATEVYLLLRSTLPRTIPQAFVPLNPNYVSTSKLLSTGRDLFGRGLEVEMLDGAWADSKTHVLSLIAWGGVGKSSLVNHWLRGMRRDYYRGAERVFAWSFYRQGTSEQGVSADQFIDAALRWFGDPNPNEGSPWDKGERLARLIKAQRTLLLLDGLEPLQYPPGPQAGKLKEQSMQALLRELADTNPGLCVITSRLPVTDLEDYEGDTARRINLEHLSPRAGAEVLRAQKVVGEQDELEKASTEFGGHALALTLLGSYLHNVYDGDIQKRDQVEILREDEEQGGHAQRVMASYEKWFAERAELNVLRMLGLFDRPADRTSLSSLRATPSIPGLTDSLQDLSEEGWRRALNRLREARLIAEKDVNQPDTVDTHPLVRGYFRRQLKQQFPDAWREGNDRLYEHLKRTAKEFPDTIEEMSLLYAAVSHGCEAYRHQDVFEAVYRKRIHRRNDYFSWRYLGAFSADLAALSNFFDFLWYQLVDGITDREKALALNIAGFHLRALGRLTEATQPMEAGLKADISRGDWENAAIAAGNLSGLYLIMGDLAQALTYARQSVELADKSDNTSQPISRRATLANVLHQTNRISEAEAAFSEAEEMHKKRQPKFPILYSVSGFMYCDLLIEQERYEEVENRIEKLFEWRVPSDPLLNIALENLSIGRAYLIQGQREATNDFSQAANFLNQAVNGLRQAGALEFLACGLLAHAELHRLQGKFSEAQADLEEAMSITTRGGMKLYQTDCHLEFARLYLAKSEKEKAHESWEKAKEMIERMGYHRRDKDVEEIGKQLAKTSNK